MTRPPFPPSVQLPTHIRFGRGCSAQWPDLVRSFGPHGLLVHGASLRLSGRRNRLLEAAPGLAESWECPPGEPLVGTVDRLREAIRSVGASWLLAVGGGSVLDTAKAAAGLAYETAPTAEFHAGRPLLQEALPWVAVPTTAGTGAEVTPNAVLTDPEKPLKKSLRDDRLTARAVLLDSTLLAGSPPDVIANAGMDALTQAIEAYTSRYANAWSDALAFAAITLILPNLPRVYAHSEEADSADALLAGNTLAGFAFTQSRLGVVHGLAHPLGAWYHQPHGLVCALCLPLALEFNRPVLGDKAIALDRIAGGDIVAHVRALNRQMKRENPFSGQPIPQKADIIHQTVTSATTAANPRPVTPADVEWFLDRLFADS